MLLPLQQNNVLDGGGGPGPAPSTTKGGMMMSGIGGLIWFILAALGRS
jgi:hypothetical protein